MNFNSFFSMLEKKRKYKYRMSARSLVKKNRPMILMRYASHNIAPTKVEK